MTTYFELLLSTLKYLRPPGESWKTPYTSASIVAIICPSISFCGALNQNYSCLFAQRFPSEAYPAKTPSVQGTTNGIENAGMEDWKLTTFGAGSLAPLPPISVYYSNSIQFQLLAECLFGIEIIQLLQKRRHPAIESVPLSAKKGTKSSAAEYTTHTLTRPSISLPWKTFAHTNKHIHTYSDTQRHLNT